jgi:hypothetical protein
MFAPLNFSSVRSLHSTYMAVAKEIWPDPFPEKELNSASEVRARDWQTISWNRYSEATRALLQFLGECEGLAICTTSGIPLNIDPAILYREMAESKIGFAGLWALNHQTWCVDLDRATRWLSGAQSEIDHLRKTIRLRSKNGLNSDDYSERLNRLWRGEQTAKMLVDAYASFQKASLVLPESAVPTKAEIKNQILTKDLFDRPPSMGRPSTREQVRDAFLARFSNGRGRTPWKEVQQAIEDECGIFPSVDTIKRSLGLRD